ncbi:MAG: TonB family protein [Mucilaginibacter sp.]
MLSLVVCLLLFQTTKASAPDSLVIYLKNNGNKVIKKDSADFYRVILPPDTNIDKDLYRIYDYYFNGKPKSVATSLTQPINLVLDGTCIDYFSNGRRKRIAQYKNGRTVGEITDYYPNGKLYNIIKIQDLNSGYYSRYYNGYYTDPGYSFKVQVIELRDSTGNILATNGTGHVVIFDEDFKKVLLEGNLKNNKKEGEWRGLIADSGSFICVFHKDELKSGLSYLKSGKHYTFKEIDVRPVFSDGMDAFYRYIKKNLQYPESAKKHKVIGQVIVGFNIEPNGTISNVTVERGLLKSLDDEAVRVVSYSPLWIPAYRFGIPIRTHHTVPISFSDY